MTNSPMSYDGVGVDYDLVDPAKCAAQQRACRTARHLKRFGYNEVEGIRGESCYLYETPDCYRARVNEGLGTKNLVADAVYRLALADEVRRLTRRSHYHKAAIDTIAMIVNDMVTVGASPIVIDMYLAAGCDDWFKDELRYKDLYLGWERGCDIVQCTWGGGDTAVVKGMVDPSTVVLSGSADGEIKPKDRFIKPAIKDGDAIVFLASSGIHANGLTMAREIAEKISDDQQKVDGYLQRLPDGATYGEALLEPTTIYVPLIETLLNNKVKIHYAVNITGHGWRKLMRAKDSFVYVIDAPGEVPALFRFMQEHGPITDQEAYGTLNMGAGFALYVPEREVQRVIYIAATCGIHAWRAGHIEKHGNEKRVVIPLKGIEFAADSMTIR